MQNITDPYISEKPLKEDEYYRQELIRESRNDRYFWDCYQQLTDINLERYDNEKGLAAWISSQYAIDPVNAEQSIRLAKKKIRDYVERHRYPLIDKLKRKRKKLTKREKRELKRQLPLARAEIRELTLVLSLIIKNGSNRQQSIIDLMKTPSCGEIKRGISSGAPNSSKSTARKTKKLPQKNN